MAASGVLLNPSPLEDFKASASRHNVLLSPSKPIQVFIATLGEQSSMVPLEVSQSDTIASIKLRIQAHRGFFTDRQRLVYAGKELIEDDKKLRDYGVDNGDVLHLVLRLSDLVSLTVKCVNGSSFVYKVMQRENVKEMSKMLSLGHEDGSSEGSSLSLSLHVNAILKGENVEDMTDIKEFILKGETLLCLRVSKPILRSRSCGRGEVELVVTSKIDSCMLSLDNLLDTISNGKSSPPSATKAMKLPVVGKEETPSSVAHNVNNLFHRYPSLKAHPRFVLPKFPISFELSPLVRELVDHCKMGLYAGHSPKLTPEGSGGVYMMKDECGLRNVAVFKPVDEEPMAVNNPRGFFSYDKAKKGIQKEGLKKGTRSGEGALREVAAYILDHPMFGPRAQTRKDVARRGVEGFAGVPPTFMAKCYHEAFHYSSAEDHVHRNMKMGSLQKYVDALSSCEDMGSSKFSVEEVHKITVLDMRLANTDRNGGNILVCKGPEGLLKLVPIDHGYCLPEHFEECTFEWLYWPQARKPYGASTVEYIKSLDADEDIELLRNCGWNLRPQSAHVLRISTMLLKKGASAGLTPFEIGSIMSRIESPDVKSPIELILEEAETMNVKDQLFLDVVSSMLDEYIGSMKAQ